MTFVDEDTGDPIVDRIGRIDSIYPEGAMSRNLPDMIIHWVNAPASGYLSPAVWLTPISRNWRGSFLTLICYSGPVTTPGSLTGDTNTGCL